MLSSGHFISRHIVRFGILVVIIRQMDRHGVSPLLHRIFRNYFIQMNLPRIGKRRIEFLRWVDRELPTFLVLRSICEEICSSLMLICIPRKMISVATFASFYIHQSVQIISLITLKLYDTSLTQRDLLLFINHPVITQATRDKKIVFSLCMEFKLKTCFNPNF